MIGGALLLRDLRNSNFTLLQLLNSFVFGNKEIRPYEESKSYNIGDLIIQTDENNKIKIYQATRNGITGEFDITKWSEKILSNIVSQNTDNVVMISKTQPVLNENRVWYCPIAYDVGQLPEPTIENVTAMATAFSLDAFPLVDETVPEGDVGLFFDIEGQSESSTEITESEFSDVETTPLSDPDNVKISDDPSYDPETIIWGDTDLTDNI